MENKRDQNKSYYERNRERLLEKAKARAAGKVPSDTENQGSVVDLFKSEAKSSAKKAKSEAKSGAFIVNSLPVDSRYFFFMALAVLITAFLSSETAKFFLALDHSWAGACVKSAILEGSAIAFALMPSRSRTGSIFSGVMVFLIYSFGVWAVSYPILSGTQAQLAQSELQRKAVAELEQEITKKVEVRDRSWGQDRVSLARKYDQSLEALRSRLDTVRIAYLGAPSVSLSLGLLISGVLFRILSMIANFACIRVIRNWKTYDWNRGTSCPH